MKLIHSTCGRVKSRKRESSVLSPRNAPTLNEDDMTEDRMMPCTKTRSRHQNPTAPPRSTRTQAHWPRTFACRPVEESADALEDVVSARLLLFRRRRRLPLAAVVERDEGCVGDAHARDKRLALGLTEGRERAADATFQPDVRRGPQDHALPDRPDHHKQHGRCKEQQQQQHRRASDFILEASGGNGLAGRLRDALVLEQDHLDLPRQEGQRGAVWVVSVASRDGCDDGVEEGARQRRGADAEGSRQHR
eukprot:2130876-Rhodomonas_salina.3